MSALTHLVGTRDCSQGQDPAVPVNQADEQAITISQEIADQESGYIKLYRSLMNCHFADKPKYLSTWVHMLMLCTHKPINTLLGRSQKKIRLLPGQFVSGRHQLAQKVGTSEKEMRTIIHFFEQEGLLRKDSSRFGTLFTVVHYPGQNEGDAKCSSTTLNQPQESTQTNTPTTSEDSAVSQVTAILKTTSQSKVPTQAKKGQQSPTEIGQTITERQTNKSKVIKPLTQETMAKKDLDKTATKQENNSNEFNKLNSMGTDSNHQQKITDQHTTHGDSFDIGTETSAILPSTKPYLLRPTAVVQDNEGKKWGTQDDLNNARHMADTVARLQGVSSSPLSDQKLVNWADECRRLRGMKTTSGKAISPQHIKTLWDFAHQDSFWQHNLLSPKSLRKHWERLAVQYHQKNKLPGRARTNQKHNNHSTTYSNPAYNSGRTPFINHFDTMNYQDSEQLPDWAKEA